jgi:hypothetical protein
MRKSPLAPLCQSGEKHDTAGMTSEDGGTGDESVPRLKVPWLGEILRFSQGGNASHVLFHVFIMQYASGRIGLKSAIQKFSHSLFVKMKKLTAGPTILTILPDESVPRVINTRLTLWSLVQTRGNFGHVLQDNGMSRGNRGRSFFCALV